MTREETWLAHAEKCGFTHAAPLEISTLKPMEMVRSACAEDRCNAYGKNWTCPPHCGTLEECEEKLRSYSQGILLQTVHPLKKTIDTKGYAEAERQHLLSLWEFAVLVQKTYPDVLCLGSGGCRVCAQCAWPEPCRCPEKAYGSMEGYGLFVTQVCRDNGLSYYHGEKTVTYTACVLF